MCAPISMLLCLPICASCAAVEPAVVVRPEMVKAQLPEALIVPCPPPDKRQWRTTRDIIATADAEAAALKTCSAQVDGIRAWSEGPK